MANNVCLHIYSLITVQSAVKALHTQVPGKLISKSSLVNDVLNRWNYLKILFRKYHASQKSSDQAEITSSKISTVGQITKSDKSASDQIKSGFAFENISESLMDEDEFCIPLHDSDVIDYVVFERKSDEYLNHQ